MPTREYADLVSAIAETIEQMLIDDPMILSEQDQTPDAPNIGGAPAHAYVVDYEKIAWHYPDAPSRLIEE